MATLRLTDLAFIANIEPVFDVDAQAYINRIQVADNAALELAVRQAINDFVVGCKRDGIWNAINACCIMAGARTLNGAVQPLKGLAPTQFNFVSADYNRKSGLRGDGTTKYIDSNRANNADPQNDFHMSVFVKTITTSLQNRYYMGRGASGTSGSSVLYVDTSNRSVFINRQNNTNTVAGLFTGFMGTNRAASNSYEMRVNGATTQAGRSSTTPLTGNIFVHATNGNTSYSDGRLAFYSIGTNLNMALLDARITTLLNTYLTVIVGASEE